MNNDDTVKLLRECDAGVKMGIDAFEEVLDNVGDDELKDILTKSKEDHEELDRQIKKYLTEFHDEGKEPGMMASTMSWLKTNMKLAINESDTTIATLMTEGCDMGIRSIYKYLNQYTEADEKIRDLAQKIINIQENLRSKIKKFL